MTPVLELKCSADTKLNRHPAIVEQADGGLVALGDQPHHWREASYAGLAECRTDDAPQTIAWIEDRFAGKPAANDCRRL